MPRAAKGFLVFILLILELCAVAMAEETIRTEQLDIRTGGRRHSSGSLLYSFQGAEAKRIGIGVAIVAGALGVWLIAPFLGGYDSYPRARVFAWISLVLTVAALGTIFPPWKVVDSKTVSLFYGFTAVFWSTVVWAARAPTDRRSSRGCALALGIVGAAIAAFILVGGKAWEGLGAALGVFIFTAVQVAIVKQVRPRSGKVSELRLEVASDTPRDWAAETIPVIVIYADAPVTLFEIEAESDGATLDLPLDAFTSSTVRAGVTEFKSDRPWSALLEKLGTPAVVSLSFRAEREDADPVEKVFDFRIA
jgi:hypothetical protein